MSSKKKKCLKCHLIEISGRIGRDQEPFKNEIPRPLLYIWYKSIADVCRISRNEMRK